MTTTVGGPLDPERQHWASRCRRRGDIVKGAYKEKSRRHDREDAAKKRNRRRNRRIAILVLLTCVLVGMIIAGYLTNGQILQGFGTGGSGANQTAATAPSQDTAGKDQGTGSSEPTVLLGEFFTDYSWDPDPNRQSNLKTASKKIDGTILAPGETFSALNTLAPPEDYEDAKVFANGGVDRTEGGGLCQVSSTLYMAANYAGLELVERNPHYAELPYIQPGLDATVWFGENGWGALDMKFKNNTDQNVMLREYVNDQGFLVAQIYGEKPTGKQVSMDSEKVEENPNKGIKWDTYKTVKDDKGNVLEDGLLFETVYSYNPPVPAGMAHKTNEPRGSGWLDPTNTTGWANNR
jgi:VanW like protein